MITRHFEIRGEKFESLTFNQKHARTLAGWLNYAEEHMYSVDKTTAAFPLAHFLPYPTKPEDYPLSGVPLDQLSPESGLDGLLPKGALKEPRLFHMTGANIELVIVQQDFVAPYDLKVWFGHSKEDAIREERQLRAQQNYLQGSVSLTDPKASLHSVAAFYSKLEEAIRKCTGVAKDDATAKMYANMSASTQVHPIARG